MEPSVADSANAGINRESNNDAKPAQSSNEKGSKLKSFVTGTASRFSKPVAFGVERAKKAARGSSDRSPPPQKGDMAGEEAEEGKTNKFKNFMSHTRVALKKTGQITKKAVAEIKPGRASRQESGATNESEDTKSEQDPILHDEIEGAADIVEEIEQDAADVVKKVEDDPVPIVDPEKHVEVPAVTDQVVGSAVETEKPVVKDNPPVEEPVEPVVVVSETVDGNVAVGEEPVEEAKGGDGDGDDDEAEENKIADAQPTESAQETQEIQEIETEQMEGDSEVVEPVLKDEMEQEPDLAAPEKKARKGLKNLVHGTKNAMTQGRKITTKAVSATTTRVKRVFPRRKNEGAQETEADASQGETEAAPSEETQAQPASTSTNKVRWPKAAVKSTGLRISKLVRRNEDGSSSKDSSGDAAEETLDEDAANEDAEAELVEQEDPIEEGDTVIQMTPTLKILLHDTTLAVLFFSLFALIPTMRNWHVIAQEQIPTSVMVVWLVFAFGMGERFGRWRVMTMAKSATMLRSEGYELASSLSKPFRIKLRFPTVGGMEVKARKKTSEKVWTTLVAKERKRKSWEVNGYVKVSDPLMNRLLQHSDFQRKSLKDITVESLQQEEYGASDLAAERPEINSMDDIPASIKDSFRLGAVDMHRLRAESLEDELVVPSFRLRGLDWFQVERGEYNVVDHPFLVKNGLRKKSTLMVNVVLSWANILIYFELPEWFTDFDSVVENDDDEPSVKAVKRFFNGTDDYRNSRLKFYPSLVDGPYAIKMFMPSKKELTAHGRSLNLKWKKHGAEELPDGTQLKPCLEVVFDVMGNKTFSRTISMMRRYVKSIVLDMAIIVSKPMGQKEDEPSACLGFWRVDGIDVENCPWLPKRDEGTPFNNKPPK